MTQLRRSPGLARRDRGPTNGRLGGSAREPGGAALAVVRAASRSPGL
jgi:hypothetical protein